MNQMTRWMLCLLMCALSAPLIAACTTEDQSAQDATSSDGDGGGDGADAEVTPTFRAFYYVKILDRSDGEGTTNPGADIDAVRLSKPDGTRHFVSNVLDYQPKAGAEVSAESSVTDNVKGEPTAFAAVGQDFNTADASSQCSLADEHYLGLGGPGGFVIVEFSGKPVENGDVITVYEVGNCGGNAEAPGFPDAVQVDVSIGTTIDEMWQTVLVFQAGPVMEGVVTGLPQIPVQ